MQSLILALVYLPGIRAPRCIHWHLGKLVHQKVAASAQAPTTVSKAGKEGSMLCAWLLNPAMLNKTRPVFIGL